MKSAEQTLTGRSDTVTGTLCNLCLNAGSKTCYVNEKLAGRKIGRCFVINMLIFALNMLQLQHLYVPTSLKMELDLQCCFNSKHKNMQYLFSFAEYSWRNHDNLEKEDGDQKIIHDFRKNWESWNACPQEQFTPFLDVYPVP